MMLFKAARKKVRTAARPVRNDPAAPCPAAASAVGGPLVADLARRDPVAAATLEVLETRTLFSVPNGPFASSATFANNAINVNWYSSSNDETGFRVERETVGGSYSTVATVAAGQTSFTDAAVASQTQYQYRVTAFNGGGDSSATETNAASGTLSSNAGAYQGGTSAAPAAGGSYAVPNGPFLPTAKAASASSVTLAWYSSSGGTESGFKILRSANGGAATLAGTVGAGVTAFTDSNLAAGTTYSYTVAAYSLGGDSTYSAAASVTTQAGTSGGTTGGTTTPTPTGGTATSIPNGPFALSAATASSGITLKWYSSSNNETGFRVQRTSDSGATWVTAGTTAAGVTTFTDTAVVAGTSYTYVVCAYNNKGDSGWTNVFTATAGAAATGGATTTPPPATTTPTGATGSSTAGSGINFKPGGGANFIPYGPFALANTAVTTSSITISWYSSSNGSEGGFVIYRKYGGGVYVPVGVTATNVTSWTDANVVSGTHYSYQVAAYSSAGLSNLTNALTCSPALTGGVASASSTGATPTWPAGFFSIGTYLQPDTSMAKWAARGINTMWDYQTNQSWLGIWNRAAQAAGMKVIRNASVNPADDIGDTSLLAYLIEDEPEIQDVSAAHLKAEYNALKAANPNVPVLLNVSAANVVNMLDATTDQDYRDFAQAADILSSDVYPLSTYGDPSYIDLLTYKSPYEKQWDRGPANPGNGVEVFRNITSGGPAKSQIAFIETSLQNADSSFSGARAPTADEVRGEIWDSIVHGARGICYFPFAFPSNSDGTPAPVAAEMTKQDALITSLAPVITSFNDANPQEIAGLPKGIEGMTRTYNGHTYYFIFNMSHTAQSNMKITLPGQGNATATVVNEGRTANVSGGSLTDSFGAYGLHIYMV